MKLGLTFRSYDLVELLTTRRGWKHVAVSASYWAHPVLFQAAAFYRRFFVRRTRLTVVIGTLGKSSATRLTTAVLKGSAAGTTEHNAGALLAWKLLQIRPGQRRAVIEVGISRRGQMRKYARFLKPDIVVVMSIGSEHNRSLGSLEETREEKAEMVRALPAEGLAVLNGDDPQVRLMARGSKARVTTFGLDPSCDVSASDITLDWPAGTRFTLRIRGGESKARTKLIGRHLVYSALAAAAVGAEEGIPLDDILTRLTAAEPAPGRMQPVTLRNGAVLLCDDCKSTMESVETAFMTLAEIEAGRRLAVMGDISEPRGSSYPHYRTLARLCLEACRLVVFTGFSRKLRTMAASVRSSGGPPELFIDARSDVLVAAEILRCELRAGDVVLIKGRASQKLKRVALALQGRRVRCRRPECRFKLQDCACCPSL